MNHTQNPLHHIARFHKLAGAACLLLLLSCWNTSNAQLLDTTYQVVVPDTFGPYYPNTEIRSVFEQPNGDFVLSCSRAHYYQNPQKSFFRRVDANGAILQEVDVPNSVYHFKSIQTSDGGYVMVHPNSGDIELKKVDSTFAPVWSSLMEGATRETAYDGQMDLFSVFEVGPTNIAYLDRAEAGNFIGPKIWFLNHQGDTVWTRKVLSSVYPGDPVESYAGCVSNDGNILAAGQASSGYFVAKYDTTGNLLWHGTTPVTQNIVRAVKQVPTSDIIVVCESNGGMALMVFDAQGNYQTEHQIALPSGYNYVTVINSIEVDNGLLIPSTIYDQNEEATSYLLKVDYQGNKLWENIIPRGSTSQLFEVKPRSNGTYVACGYAADSTVQFNGWLLTSDSQGNFPNAIALSIFHPAAIEDAVTAFPNPSSGRFQFQLPTNTSAAVRLTIFDSMGKMVTRETFPASAAVRVDLFGQPSGWYMYQLSTNEKALGTGKLIVR